MNSYEQWDKLMLLAREHKLDVDDTRSLWIRIGGKRYTNHIDASVALLVAFDKVGIAVPKELKERPDDLG